MDAERHPLVSDRALIQFVFMGPLRIGDGVEDGSLAAGPGPPGDIDLILAGLGQYRAKISTFESGHAPPR